MKNKIKISDSVNPKKVPFLYKAKLSSWAVMKNFKIDLIITKNLFYPFQKACALFDTERGVAGSHIRLYREYNFWDKKFSSNTFTYNYIFCIHIIHNCYSLISTTFGTMIFIHFCYLNTYNYLYIKSFPLKGQLCDICVCIMFY